MSTAGRRVTVAKDSLSKSAGMGKSCSGNEPGLLLEYDMGGFENSKVMPHLSKLNLVKVRWRCLHLVA